MSEDMKEFFENRDAVKIVDWMAKRYGKLPHEILTGMTAHEFNINSGVMLVSMAIEAEEHRKATEKVEPETANAQFKSLKEFGIKVKVKTEKKESK